MVYAQPARAVMLFCTVLALPLAIAANVASLENEKHARYRNYWHWYGAHRNVTALCFTYFGLVSSAALSLATFWKLRKTGKPLGPRFVWADLLSFFFYLSVLIPIWVREIGEIEYSAALVVLYSYMTAPMIVNMALHALIVLRRGWSMLPVLFSKSTSAGTQCPNCHGTIRPGISQQVRQAVSGYSLLRGEDYLDEDAVQYKDARDSEDLLRSRESADVQPDEHDSHDKGKIALDV